MTALGIGLAVFGIWVAVVLGACALLGAARRKSTPSLSQDFSLWESESSSGTTDEAAPSSTGPGSTAPPSSARRD